MNSKLSVIERNSKIKLTNENIKVISFHCFHVGSTSPPNDSDLNVRYVKPVSNAICANDKFHYSNTQMINPYNLDQQNIIMSNENDS